MAIKICEEHWSQLKTAIVDKGMGHLIKSADEVRLAIEREINGESQLHDHDPLMSSNWAICSNALEAGGLYLMFGEEELCPLCELEKHTPANASDWIEPCTNAELALCRERGLVPALQ
jgi:hypothetical protein